MKHHSQLSLTFLASAISRSHLNREKLNSRTTEYQTREDKVLSSNEEKVKQAYPPMKRR
jgi:hypothetical protein